MSAQRYPLFNNKTFADNDEFLNARACQNAMNADQEPSKQAQTAYDTVLKRVMKQEKVSESDAEEKLEQIINDETRKRQAHGNTQVAQAGKQVSEDTVECRPRVQQFS